MLPVNFDIGDVVLEDGRDIDLLKEQGSVSFSSNSLVFTMSFGCRYEVGVRLVSKKLDWGGGMLFTSGKVPFEKTLAKRKRSAVGAGGKTGCSASSRSRYSEARGNIHQQTGLSAGTVSDNDKFAADLSHVAKARA